MTMSAAPSRPWLPRQLFRLSLAAAGGLVALVLFSPLLDRGRPEPQDWQRVVAVFARDTTLRRTALGSALGLAVTACIFFTPYRGNRLTRKSKSPRAADVFNG
jgi:hypothetical protein